jgi:uncharacterized tellurite resistance protein B-like protein
MFDRVIANIERRWVVPKAADGHASETKLATAIVLLHIVPVDAKIHQIEWRALKQTLADLFAIDLVKCQKLLSRASAEIAKDPNVFASAYLIRHNTTPAFRHSILAAAKCIALSDGEHHDLEIELQYRLAKLLDLLPGAKAA